MWAKHNNPGSWNDSEMSRDLQGNLLNPRKTRSSHGLLADSAFPTMEGAIITPLRTTDWRNVPPERLAAVEAMNRQVVAARQAAEWGMGAVPRVFRVLDKKLHWDKYVRRRLLINIHRLYNLRVRMTGISQIRSVFYEAEMVNVPAEIDTIADEPEDFDDADYSDREYL